MNLLKELKVITESNVKHALEEIVSKAIRRAKSEARKKPYEAAVRIILSKVRELDTQKMLKDVPDSEVSEYIRLYFQPDALWEDDEDQAAADSQPAEQPAPTDQPTEPTVIAKAGEFKVTLDENEQAHLVDADGSVRVSMPLVIWKQLCRNSGE